MKKVFVIVLCGMSLWASLPAWALFSSCDAEPALPKPDWVSRPDYSLPGHYVGVGSAEKSGKSKEEQLRVAESNAKSSLVQRIEVTIRSDNEQSTRVNSQGVQQDVQSKVTVSAVEVLRGLQIRDRWVDKDDCTRYTLLVISKADVAQAKREKTMKKRMDNFKVLLADGSDRNKYRDIKVRRKYLEDAQGLLAETDFSVLPEEIKKEIYVKQIGDALALINKESSQVSGRMALVALNQDGKLRADVIGKLLDQLRVGDSSADRLMVDCTSESDCINRANERGFSRLALLKVSSQIGTSQMGSLKGSLTISRTVYDIDSHKILKGPDNASAQVIGWSDEELDWYAAAEKAIQGLR